MMKRVLLTGLLVILSLMFASAQFTYGTTGLMHAPTADMQQDKTFMFGGGYINNDALPNRWKYSTWNYYVNITVFPWLEVAYTCTIFDEWIDRGAPIHMKNQDRFFSGRLRLWKEGWWKEWTPQIVVGANDVLHGSDEGGKIGAVEGSSENGNTFFQRYYVAATKHLSLYGKWGLHVSYVYSKRIGHRYNGFAWGVDYTVDLPEVNTLNKLMNGINLMLEYDSRGINIGGKYSIWKDHINLVGELRECRHPSIGVYFKVHLK